jgi:hypothetical protein
MPTARPTKPEDILILAPKLRKEDVAEILAVTGNDPQTELQNSLMYSEECWTIEHEGLIIGMFGVAPIHGSTGGAIRLLASDELPKIRWEFLKKTRPWVAYFLTKYPLLTNIVDSRNEVHIKWLKWAGFTFEGEIPVGPEKIPFLQFFKTRSSEPCVAMPLPV